VGGEGRGGEVRVMRLYYYLVGGAGGGGVLGGNFPCKKFGKKFGKKMVLRS